MNPLITTPGEAPVPRTIRRATLRKIVLLIEAVLTSLPPTIWCRGRDRVVGWIKDMELARGKTALERELARIVETADGHRAKGLPGGSPAYLALYRQANLKIDDYCAQHGVERLSVEQEVPVLRDLEALTQAPALAARVSKGFGILVAGIIGAITIGCITGLIAAGYHWIVRLLVG